MWLAPPFTDGAIGVLGAGKFAAQTVNLGLLIQRGSRRPAVGALGTLTGASGRGHRVGPGSLQLQDLGTMHQADGVERHHLGLLVAQPRERGGPFAGATQGIDLLAGVDHAAVHQPRHDRRQLAGDDREHRLVQPLQPVQDVALRDERAALDVAGRRDQIGVSIPFTGGGSLAGGGIRRTTPTPIQLPLGDHQCDVTALDALQVLDEPLRPRHPGVRLADPAAKLQAAGQPERTARGPPPIVGLEM